MGLFNTNLQITIKKCNLICIKLEKMVFLYLIL